MDLKKMVEDVDIYGSAYEELHELISVYLDKYKLCESKYDIKKDLWIRDLFEEFKIIYEKADFEVKEERKNSSIGYETGRYLKSVAKYKSLEFELVSTGNSKIYNSVRFMQNKPVSSEFSFELYANIEMYRIEFKINVNEKYSPNGINVYGVKTVEKVKKELEETKYSVDEMKTILSVIKSEEEKLDIKLREIEENDFKGYINKNKEDIKFISLNNLIELL